VIFDTNLKNRATSQYLGVEFETMVRFQDKIFCAGDDGLFVLEGEKDYDSNILSYFEPIETDFGVQKQKRIRALYISYFSYGEISMGILLEQGVYQSFQLPDTEGELLEYKCFPKRDLMGRFFTFHISNAPSGCDFSVETFHVQPIIISHRVTHEV